MQQPEPTRRTVMRSAVWSIPVVAVAATAPLAAASGPGEITSATATLIGPQEITVSLTLSPAVLPNPRVENFTFPDYPEVLVQGLSLYNSEGSMNGEIYTNRAVPAGAVLLINLADFAPILVPVT